MLEQLHLIEQKDATIRLQRISKQEITIEKLQGELKSVRSELKKMSVLFLK